MKKFAVLSGDLRQYYINEFFRKSGFFTELKTNMDFNGYDFIVCSTPFSKDQENINCDFYSKFPIDTFTSLLKPWQKVFGGNIPEKIINAYDETNIDFVDVLNDSHVVWNNATLTAEGLLSKIIQNTPFSINGSNALIMGFGRCGINTALRLKALGCKVTIYDHTKIHLSQASSFGFNILEYKDFSNKLSDFNIIINTVPSKIFLPEHYGILNKECILFEIASAPFGLEPTLATQNQLSLITCPGLPGVTAPKAAGELIAKSIISYLERNGINDL